MCVCVWGGGGGGGLGIVEEGDRHMCDVFQFNEIIYKHT